MAGLGNIVAQLSEARRAMRSAAATAGANDVGRLAALKGFGSNPGDLDARVYTPATAPTALVVVLHGCTQSAAIYDHGSGWSRLAERHGFALLFPQQRRANNSNLCFNWYAPNDARRGRGEAASISQMVRHLAGQYGLDRSQAFITGLSAGGAMTAVMLASYPELFAAGAIIAGLPFATADSLPEALERMRGQGLLSKRNLSGQTRPPANFDLDPPRLSVWHGTDDAIVDPANATAIVDQWRDLHGLGDAPGRVDSVAGHRRETWSAAGGRVLIERFDIHGMGHGIPLDTRDGEACGTIGPHMLQANICSTSHIANAWGLIKHNVGQHAPAKAAIARAVEPPAGPTRLPPPQQSGVGAVIENALRAAGLMR